MPDLIDYLRTGVLNGNPLSLGVPEGIERELEEGALDFADEVIDYHRQRDRAFDIACDPESSSLWTWWGCPVGEVCIGDTIRLRREVRHYTQSAFISGEVEDRDHGSYLCVRDSDGKVVSVEKESIVSISRRVPLPLDASPLGKYPTAPFVGESPTPGDTLYRVRKRHG